MTEEQRERKRACDRAYYQRNKHKWPRYVKDNRERIRENDRRSYAKNKEQRAARSREYYAKNRDRIHARKRVYYVRNREVIIAKAKEYAERPGVRDKRVRRLSRQHVERQLILWGLKKELGCIHCGESDPLVLDFHHRDPKDKVSKLPTMSSRAWPEVEKELDKCDVVCANCHARLHRKNWGALFESGEL